MTASPDTDTDDFHRHMVLTTLREVFGDIEPEVLDWVLPRMSTVALHGGEVLMRQGDAPDGVYLVLSGRLRALLERAGEPPVVLGDIARGEPIGEMGVVMQQPRGATIIALRDCALMRLSAEDFDHLVQSWPRLGLPLARKLIQRMARNNVRRAAAGSVSSICLVPLHAGLDAIGLARRLRAALAHELARANPPASGQQPEVALVDRAAAREALGPGGVDVGAGDVQAHRRQLAWLDEVESRSTLQVLLADAHDSPWTRLCLRHADHVVLLADAEGDPGVTPVEHRLIAQRASQSAPVCSLLLLHPESTRTPRRTRRWLDVRPHLDGDAWSHFHARHGHDRDWARLARILSGQAVGFVMAGGGARGFAHLGVMQALEESGFEWDLVGGTSIGAVMAACAAIDLPVARVLEVTARAFAINPTGDWNWLPLVSVIAGRRLARSIRQPIIESVGECIGIEDLWKPYFCVASNYSRAQPSVLRRGDLAESIIASVSIPAALPPVLRDGDLLVDGGTFNNFPVDVMQAGPAGRIIGVDLSRENYRPLPFTEMPTPGRLWVDRFLRPRARQRYKALPGIATTVFNVAAMASQEHQRRMRGQLDLIFTPDVSRIGMLDWGSFDRGVAIGLEHARAVLAEPSCPARASDWWVPLHARRAG